MPRKESIQKEIEKHGHLIRTLFWISLLWTIVQMGLIITFSIWGGDNPLYPFIKDIPPEFTWIWLSVVGIYAGKKRVDRWGDGVKDLRKGEWCVYIVWAVTFFLFCFKMFSSEEVTLSSQLLESFEGVSAIFFGSELLKSVDFKLQTRASKQS